MFLKIWEKYDIGDVIQWIIEKNRVKKSRNNLEIPALVSYEQGNPEEEILNTYTYVFIILNFPALNFFVGKRQ